MSIFFSVPVRTPGAFACPLPSRLLLTSALLLALSACGGGGGGSAGVRPDAPANTPPLGGGNEVPGTPAPTPQPEPEPEPESPSPTPEPEPEPEPEQEYGATAPQPPEGGLGSQAIPSPVLPVYRGTVDNLTVPTGVGTARAAGLDGKGVKVGVLDAGFLGEGVHLPSTPLAAQYQDFTNGQATDPDTVVNFQHGHYVTAALAGQPVAATAGGTAFEGGVAPQSTLYWGRICELGNCSSATVRRALDQWQQGVDLDVLNLSINTRRAGNDTDARIAQAWSSALSPLADVDTLVVVSTGNDGLANPGLPAALPAYDDRWSDNLLAVSAVRVNADGSPGLLAGYANQCGDAAQWCLVAPGSQYVGAMSDSSRGNGWVNGTSIAAPVVSGVAALVKQAHPWMSASNLQQTLLTTATDLGDPGVDAVYGWGAVDASRAIAGPALLQGRFVADVGPQQGSTLSQDIGGPGLLVKDGSGRLVLSGNNHFAGGLDIQAGTLALAGDLAGDVRLAGGSLEAAGGRIGGDFSASAGTVTQVSIGAPLQVGGQAALDGALYLRSIIAGYTPGATETVLQAGAVQGRFAEVQVGAGLFYNARLDYGADRVSAALQRTDVAATAAALSLNAQATEGALVVSQILDAARTGTTTTDDAEVPATPQSLIDLIDAPLDRASAGLRGLAASEHGARRALVVQSALAELGRDAAHLAWLPGNTVRSGLWLQSDSQRGVYTPDGFAALRHDRDGQRLGADWVLDSGSTVSASLGRARLDAHNEEGGRITSRQRRVAVGYHRAWGQGYVDGQFSHVLGKVHSLRWQALGDGREALDSRHDARMTSLRLEAGRPLDNGLVPYLAAGALRHAQDGFAERSDSGLGITTRASSDTVTFAEAGLRLGRQQGPWQHHAGLAYRQLVGDRILTLPASLQELPGIALETAATTLPASSLQLSVGTWRALGDGWEVSARLGWEKNRDLDDDLQLGVGIKRAF